ncbi:MAG: squalene/phytoene synthase family protein [Pseudomonadota bacterium]
MTSPASDSLKEILVRLDSRIRRVDEERWLSSRYASPAHRNALIVLYAFYYELARVRVAVSDPTMGQIRFQWWRDALEELAKGEPRQHDVVLALELQIAGGAYEIAALQELVVQHETAFLAQDRGLEPEAMLAAIAARVLVPMHSCGELIRSIAPAWAQLRRGETVEIGVVVTSIPANLRPALAHFRLRRAWSAGRQPGRMGKRASILLAMLTGSI